MAKFLDLTGLQKFKEKLQEWAQGAFVPNDRKINNKPLDTDITLSAEDVGAISSEMKGAASGVAELDSSGKVPQAQLPSYVDDVLEFANRTAFPGTGEDGKIYVAEDTNKTYRWSGTTYVEIASGIALGETSSTAYRGDHGKAAYEHSLKTSGNPHNVGKADVGLGNVTDDKQVKGLASGTTNGHVVTFGTDGYTVKDSGFTIGASVPANAKFTDTTYSAFKGATAGAAGGAGLVPAPKTGENKKFLKADGTWADVEMAQIGVESISEEEIDDLFAE